LSAWLWFTWVHLHAWNWIDSACKRGGEKSRAAFSPGLPAVLKSRFNDPTVKPGAGFLW
jgi:hypothetical protein